MLSKEKYNEYLEQTKNWESFYNTISNISDLKKLSEGILINIIDIVSWTKDKEYATKDAIYECFRKSLIGHYYKNDDNIYDFTDRFKSFLVGMIIGHFRT